MVGVQQRFRNLLYPKIFRDDKLAVPIRVEFTEHSFRQISRQTVVPDEFLPSDFVAVPTFAASWLGLIRQVLTAV